MNNDNNNNRTGLWVKKSKSGHNYMSGTLKLDKEYSIRIFKNERKETDKQPDYTMFYDVKEQQEQPQKNEVQLTDEDYDNLLNANEPEPSGLDLPF